MGDLANKGRKGTLTFMYATAPPRNYICNRTCMMS